MSAVDAHLEQFTSSHINLSLDRICAVAENFIPLSYEKPVVTIAGTNGKGTTVAVLDALAQHAGLRVAAYTSPHLYRFNERIKINGIEITDEKLLECLQAVERARGEVMLTYYEYTTLAALYYFHQEKPDLILLEVGMGGRLDATNIINPDIAIITSIGLDHMDYLGETKEDIALEKAGIMRLGKPVICGDASLQDFIKFQADMMGAVFYGLGKDFQLLEGLNTNLVRSNIACAAKAAELLEIPISTDVIDKVRIPGRKQLIQVKGKPVLLDVAHNDDSLEGLADYMATLDYTGVHLVVGLMIDKKVASSLNRLAQQCKTIHLAAPNTPRAMPVDQLMDVIEAPSQAYPSLDIAMACALAHCQQNEIVLVTGSFYTVAEVKP